MFTYPRNPPLARCIFMFTLFTAHTSISCTNVYISNLILISASDTRYQTNMLLATCYSSALQIHKTTNNCVHVLLLLSEYKKDYIM